MTAKTTPVDPVQEAFDNAPIGEPETEEERRLVAEAWEEHARTGKTYTQDEVEAMLAERRNREGG